MADEGMKTTFEAMITKAERFERNRKSDGKPFSIYKITTHDGTGWDTFDAGIYNMANQNVGGKALINGTIKQKDGYTNYYIDSLTILEAPQTTVQATPEPVDFKTFAAHHDASEAKRDVSIHRQVATKVAAQISEDAVEFWGNVGEIFTYFQTGEVPGPYQPAEIVANRGAPVVEQRDMSHVSTDWHARFPEDAGPSDIPPPPDEDIPF